MNLTLPIISRRDLYEEKRKIKKEAAELFAHAGGGTRTDVEYEYDSLCYADFCENIHGKDNYP